IDSPIRRSLGSSCTTSASSSSSTLYSDDGLSTRSLLSCEIWINPSIPSSISTNTPKSATELTLPCTRVFRGYRSATVFHGSVVSCLTPRLTRSLSTSIPRTVASSSSPFLHTSLGCRIFLVHDKSEMCTSPSIPGSISTNTPKSVIDLTLPLTWLPIGCLCPSSSHGFASVCLSPSEILRFASSTPSTCTSTMSFGFTTFDGCTARLLQLISETWIKPSTPFSISTNAP